MEFQCEKCLCNLLNFENIEQHRHFCGTQNICVRCKLQCVNSDHLSNHLKWCKNNGLKEYRCTKCKNQMFNEENLINHTKTCGYYVDAKSHKCKLCEKTFYRSQELSSHLIKCGKFICYECLVPFLSSNALNYHINLFQRQNLKNKQYKCSICKHLCESRSDLYRH